MSSNRKRKGRREYDPETKAAVLAALLAGQGVEQVAAQYNLPEGTVKGWKSKMKGEAPAPMNDEQKTEVGDLVLHFLREGLTTLRFQQTTLFRNPAWLEKQSAAEMATLHGVITDKCVRLLEAMDREGNPPPEPT